MLPGTERDRKIQIEVLKFYYAEFEKHPYSQVGDPGFANQFGVEEKDVDYAVGRIAGSLLKTSPHSGSRIGHAQIMAAGIDALSEAGIPTLLDNDTRFEVLRVLYEFSRESGPYSYMSVQEIAKATARDLMEVARNVVYLQRKGLLDWMGTMGPLENQNYRIDKAGAVAYENYTQHGMSGPTAAGSYVQLTIGPNEQGKAQRLFRDITELAQKEVFIVDRYLKAGTLGMLQAIPASVFIRCLTSDRVADASLVAAVAAAKAKHRLEVRVVPDAAWKLHARYLIVDGADGWVWDHSFHDAGKTQHTVSQIRPVNLKAIVASVEAHWVQGQAI